MSNIVRKTKTHTDRINSALTEFGRDNRPAPEAIVRIIGAVGLELVRTLTDLATEVEAIAVRLGALEHDH